jgi:ABC-2 type transport system permease protein
MKSILWIARREMGSFFYSPIFYVVTALFLFINSFMFVPALMFFSAQSLKATQFQQMGISLNPNEMVIEPSLANMGVILLFIIPILTMRSFAEERKNKTFSLLLSSPVHLRDIVAGKFLACLGVVAFMILLSSYTVLFVIALGQPEIGPILSGYLGVLLMIWDVSSLSGCWPLR